MSILKTAALAAALAIGGFVANASATVLRFDFTDAVGDTASGQFTIVGTSSQATVTGIAGWFDGMAITGLSPYASSDQQLFASSSPAYDVGGISFSVADGVDYNLSSYGGAPLGSINNTVDDPDGYGIDPITITSFSTGVPEPATWALMLAGVGFCCAALRSSRRRALATA